jgi:hypothetical protein
MFDPAHQFSLKNVCPNRSFSVSIKDILVLGPVACTPVEGAGTIFSGFAARWLDPFFAGSRFAVGFGFGFGASPLDFGGAVIGLTSIAAKALRRG